MITWHHVVRKPWWQDIWQRMLFMSKKSRKQKGSMGRDQGKK